MMDTFEVRDWMALNQLIYKIYADAEFDVMRKGFLEQMRMLIDFDAAQFYLKHPKYDKIMTTPICFQCEAEEQLDLEQSDYIYNLLESKRSVVVRDTELADEEKWLRTPFYRKYYLKNQWHHGLRIILAVDREVLGMIVLYRSLSKPNFNEKEVLIADSLKEHLALRVHQYQSKDEMHLISKKDNFDKKAQECHLTKKERDIMERLTCGESVEQISEELDVSVNTAKKHTVNIYRKLGINKRIQLVQMFG